MSLLIMKDQDELKIQESFYRSIIASVNGRQGFVGIDLEDKAGGYKETITLTLEEMEKVVAFYRKNVKVTK